MVVWLKLAGLTGALVLAGYLALPAPRWPEPMAGAVQSREPGDVENLAYQRAYFTDAPRAEVLAYYSQEFSRSPFGGVPLLTYRLNYPPEEAQVLVREQVKSTYLEEVVHPLRESLYVNGFEPGEGDDKISIDGREYFSKITVRYVRSSVFARLAVLAIALVVFWWLVWETRRLIQGIRS